MSVILAVSRLRFRPFRRGGFPVYGIHLISVVKSVVSLARAMRGRREGRRGGKTLFKNQSVNRSLFFAFFVGAALGAFLYVTSTSFDGG